MNKFNEKVGFKGSEDNNLLSEGSHQNSGKKKNKESFLPNKPGKWKLLGIRELNESDAKSKQHTNRVADNGKIKKIISKSGPIRPEKKQASPPATSIPKRRKTIDEKSKALAPGQSGFPGLTVTDFLTGSPETAVENMKEWMKTPKAPFYSEENILFQFDDVSMSLSAIVRDEICKQLGWSIPTYYRHKRGEQQKELSPSQTKTIIDIICKYTSGLMEFVNTLLRKTYIDLTR